MREFWDGMWEQLKIWMDDRDDYGDDEFAGALNVYRNNDIDSSIHSNNPIVRMFALLDRRTGKRTLLNIKDTFMSDHDWLRKVYEIRTEAEGLQP
jgi:hypothetical protein